MHLHLENTELLLRENQPLGLVNGKGIVVRCVAGTAWLTVDGEAGDSFLGAGQVHRLESNGLALIEAMGRPANIRLEVVRPGFRSRLARMLYQLLRPTRRFVPYYREGRGLAAGN